MFGRKSLVICIVLAILAVVAAGVLVSRGTPDRSRVVVDHVVGQQVVAVPSLKPEVFVERVNTYRGAQGVKSTLTLSPELSGAALAHARDLSSHDAMQHVGSDNSSAKSRAALAGFVSKEISEIISVGTRLLTDEQMMTLLTAKHRDLITNKTFSHIGVAKLVSPKSTFKVYWVIVLASK